MDVTVSTIDGILGREGGVVVLATVWRNIEGKTGSVEDERRLNTAWIRPRLGLIIVGDRRTLQNSSALGRRALDACAEVVIARCMILVLYSLSASMTICSSPQTRCKARA